MTLRKLVLATVAAILVAGCGGTGGGVGDNTPTTPETASKKAGFTYLNELRRGTGLIELDYLGTIEKAAQNHANYLNDVYARYGVNDTHYEPHDSQYKTGGDCGERMHHAGWSRSTSWEGGEVIAFTGGEDTVPSIKGLMTAIYHRFIILSPTFDEVGIGIINASQSACVVDFGGSPTLGDKSAEIIVYPYNGEKDAWPYFDGVESPSPFAGTNLYSSGNPISVEFNKAKITNVTLKSFSLKDGSGANVDIVFQLTSRNDKSGFITNHQFAFFPRESLAYDENYTAKITYEADGKTGSKEWTFHTISVTGKSDDSTSGDKGGTQVNDHNVTDTNQTFVVQSDVFDIFHILPGNDRIANDHTLGKVTIEGKTADNRNNSTVTYDKGNDVKINIHGQSGDWIVVTFENLKNNKTGEKLRVRVEAK